jgi:hypothetical protein
MTGPATAMVTPLDVRQAASVCCRALQPVADLDWDSPTGDLEWSCRATLGHVLAALLYYAINPHDPFDRAAALRPGGPVAPGPGAPRRHGGTGRAPHGGVRGRAPRRPRGA